MKQFSRAIKMITENSKTLFVFCLALTVLVFHNTLAGDFFMDDFALIVDNASVHSFKNFFSWFTENRLGDSGFTSDLYRPFATIFTAVLYFFFTDNPLPYHGVNLLLHALNGALIFTLLTKVKLTKTLALIATVFFLIHPVQSESVGYIAGMTDLLATTTLLGAILYSIKINVKISDYIIFPLLVASSYLTKESTIVLPLLLLACGYYASDKVADTNICKFRQYAFIVALILAGILLTLRFTVLDFTAGFGLTSQDNAYTTNILTRIITFVSIIPEYMVLTFFPKDLYFFKPYNFTETLFTVRGVIGALLLSGAVMEIITGAKKRSLIGFGFFLFFILLAPVSGLIPANALYTEHWLYLPIVGVLLTVIIGAEKLIAKYKTTTLGKKITTPEIVTTIILLLVLLLGARTYFRNFAWSDAFTFYETEYKYSPESPRTLNDLAVEYMNKNDHEKAISLFKKAIENAKKEGIEFGHAYFNMGNAYMNINKPERAIPAYLKAIEYNDIKKAYFALFQIYSKVTNQPVKAMFMKSIIERKGNGENIEFAEIQTISTIEEGY